MIFNLPQQLFQFSSSLFLQSQNISFMAQLEAIAIFRVKLDAIEVARPQIHKLVEETRKEPGCIRYDWYQDAKEPGTFIAIEVFANAEAFEQHRQNPHLKEVLAESANWITSPPEVRVLTREFVK